MIYGTTREDYKFSFSGKMFGFTIPKGTRVVWGEKDCAGVAFPYWVLPFDTAIKLSGNTHDPVYRFVTVDSNNVDIEDEE